ncbi:MAG: S46 family peptidase, partial [Gemmatimonadota bacterium]
MSDLKILLRRFAALPLVALAACASSQPSMEPAAPAPPQRTVAMTPAAAPAAPVTVESQAAAMLTPPASAERTAASVTLTGTELGTMWTFENPPLDYWARTYDFRPNQAWLDQVRLSSVKISGCSASFVSPDGLIMTNHHCARGCVAQNSTPEMDYVEKGFIAETRDDEKLCRGAYADVLIGIEDVTARVRAVERPGMSNAQIAEATQQITRQIASECQQAEGTVCRIVPLYNGGQYQLYTYRHYTPLKLVFAVELQSGFFGGDYDNFVYPRYALDFAFMRVYEADGVTPISSPNYFPIDPNGPEDGELVFITGNPGSTARLITLAQLMYERSYNHPMRVDVYDASRDRYHKQMETASPQQLIQLRERVFGVENSLKKYEYEVVGLMDSTLVATKIKWETEFREKAKTTPAAQPYLDVWDNLYDLQLQKLQIAPVLNAANPSWLGSEYLTLPAAVIETHRLAAMSEEERAAAQRGMRGFRRGPPNPTAPVSDPAMALMALEQHFTLAAKWLPEASPLRAEFVREGETPAQTADRLARSSQILDPAFRQRLVDGGMDAVKASTDPMVRLVLAMEAASEGLQQKLGGIAEEESVQRGRLARAAFAVYGNQLPPDATSTLRISDGLVRGYAYNGTLAPYKTVFHGMFARSIEFNGVEPFNLPERFAARADFINMNTPV